MTVILQAIHKTDKWSAWERNLLGGQIYFIKDLMIDCDGWMSFTCTMKQTSGQKDIFTFEKVKIQGSVGYVGDVE